ATYTSSRSARSNARTNVPRWTSYSASPSWTSWRTASRIVPRLVLSMRARCSSRRCAPWGIVPSMTPSRSTLCACSIVDMRWSVPRFHGSPVAIIRSCQIALLTDNWSSERMAAYPRWEVVAGRNELVRAEVTRNPSREELLKRAAVAGLVLTGSGGLAQVARAGVAAAAAAPKRGGTFRVGVAGGSSSDIIDGQDIVTNPDQARLMAGFETLVTFDKNFKLAFDGLAEEVSPNKAGNVWTIRVRPGIEFHNGKTLS